MFCSKIFLSKIFLVKIFDKYFDCENIFCPALLIAHPLLPYLKPPALLTHSAGIFEVKCDRQTKDELTDRTHPASTFCLFYCIRLNIAI